MTKIALVLSGGGFKGAFQVGALQYLNTNWNRLNSTHATMKFDIIAGVSVGALNGLLLAANRFTDLTSLWQQVAENGVEEIYTSDFIDTPSQQTDLQPELKFQLTWKTIKKHFPDTTRNILLKALFNRKSILKSFGEEFQKLKSLADNTPLKNKLREFCKKESITNCIYKCGYVSLTDGKYYSKKHTDFVSDEDFMNGVLASTVMPIIWQPVDFVGTTDGVQESLVDGGIRNVSPLGDVIREIHEHHEEYVIIIINCSTEKIVPEDFRKKNIAQIALRSLVDISITEIFNHDLKEFIDKNYILQQIRNKLPNELIYDYDYHNREQGKPLRYFKAIIIQPDTDVLGDSLIANKSLTESRINHGIKKAELALQEYSQNSRDFKFTIV